MDQNYLDVLTYFIIPFGMGIPNGIIKAKSLNINWELILFIYFISDLILAAVFEPILVTIIKYGRTNKKLTKFGIVFKQAMQQTAERIGTGSGPFALVLFTFGSDPMTGRISTKLAGYGFISGWLIAIAGDMLYFSVIMVSTLWLSHLLGDGTMTVFIIFGIMIVIPIIIKKLRS